MLVRCYDLNKLIKIIKNKINLFKNNNKIVSDKLSLSSTFSYVPHPMKLFYLLPFSSILPYVLLIKFKNYKSLLTHFSKAKKQICMQLKS
jgi:hypothetical protein